MPYPPLSNQRGVIPALQLRRETGDGSASLLHATKAANDELSKIVSKGSDILKPASKSSSSTLKQSIKIGSIAAGAAGVTYLGVNAVAAGSDGDVITPPPDINYNYNTGNEKVDEALNWLQKQIDEIVSYLNGLIGRDTSGGGSSGGSGGSIFDDGSTTGGHICGCIPGENYNHHRSAYCGRSRRGQNAKK